MKKINKKKPLIVNQETVVPFDCDKTLIDYSTEGAHPNQLIKIGLIPGEEIIVARIEEHIQMMKNMYAAKMFVIVWSASGWEWAAHIVKKLGLTKYVSLVMSKPKFYVDDIPAESFMKRLYNYPKYMEHRNVK